MKQEPVVRAVEAQEQVSQFQESTRNNVRDVRHETNSLERKVQLLERARSDSWEVISQRLNSMVGDSVGALSDRLTDLEQTVQSRRTTPVTDANASQVHVEALASVEQALTHEIGRMKDEYDKSMLKLCDLLERLDQKQRCLEKQLTGLTSFAKRVEEFLEQSTSEGATAPTERPKATRHGRKRPTATLDQTPGASSSSTRPPPYVQAPEPPSVPAPPVPSDVSPTPDDQQSSTTRFNTVRSEVRAGAIRIDLTNPEQWSAGDTAILRNQEAKRVRDIGSLIFETPIQHDYEASIEVRSLLSTERLEDIDGRLTVTDEDSHAPRVRYVKFWGGCPEQPDRG